MKVVIAGSRKIDHRVKEHMRKLEEAIARFRNEYGPITMVVCGKANGPDTLGEMWARDNNVHIAYFPAKWDLHGNAAGPIRNKEMGDFADAGIILWDGKSKGSANMASILYKQYKPFILDTFEPLVYNEYHHNINGVIEVRKEFGFHKSIDRFYDDK